MTLLIYTYTHSQTLTHTHNFLHLVCGGIHGYTFWVLKLILDSESFAQVAPDSWQLGLFGALGAAGLAALLSFAQPAAAESKVNGLHPRNPKVQFRHQDDN